MNPYENDLYTCHMCHEAFDEGGIDNELGEFAEHVCKECGERVRARERLEAERDVWHALQGEFEGEVTERTRRGLCYAVSALEGVGDACEKLLTACNKRLDAYREQHAIFPFIYFFREPSTLSGESDAAFLPNRLKRAALCAQFARECEEEAAALMCYTSA